MLRRLTGTLAAIAVLTGCEGKVGWSNPVPVGPIGAQLPVQESRRTVADITVSALRTRRSAGAPDPVGTVVTVDVEVVGVRGATQVRRSDWTAETRDDAQLHPVAASTMPDGSVTPGRRLQGTLVFDLPEGKTLWSIIDNYGGLQIGTWSAR